MQILKVAPAGSGELPFDRLIVYHVPDCLANILDKKIQGVTLNCLERFVDWILSSRIGTRCYFAYHTLFELKRELVFHNGGDFGNTGAYAVRHFRNGIRLFDLARHTTIQQRGDQEILWNAGTEILFPNAQNMHEPFSRAVGTQYVVMTGPQIVETTIDGGENRWNLNMEKWQNRYVYLATPENEIRRPVISRQIDGEQYKQVPSPQGLTIYNATRRKVVQVIENDAFVLKVEDEKRNLVTVLDERCEPLSFDRSHGRVLISDREHGKKGYEIEQGNQRLKVYPSLLGGMRSRVIPENDSDSD